MKAITLYSVYIWALALLAFATTKAAHSQSPSWNSSFYDRLHVIASQRAIARRVPGLANVVSTLRSHRAYMAAFCQGNEFSGTQAFAKFLDHSIATVVVTLDSQGVRNLECGYLVTTVRLMDRFYREKGRIQNAAQGGRMYPNDWGLIWHLRHNTQRLASLLGEGPINFEPFDDQNIVEDNSDRRSREISQAIELLSRSEEAPCVMP